MRAMKIAMIVGLVGCVTFPLAARVWGDDSHGDGDDIVLTFEPTVMLSPTPPPTLTLPDGSKDGWPISTSPWPPNGTNPSVKGMNAKGWMVISQKKGHTTLDFYVRGARSNTLYTIWTVFPPLTWCLPSELHDDPGCSKAFRPLTLSAGVGVGNTKPGLGQPPLGFYPEGGVVAPTASLSKAFTSGMGLDPGATFFTDRKGDGELHLKLDYSLLGTTYDDGPPVGNATTVKQCAVPGGPPLTKFASCPQVELPNGLTTTPSFTVTSSWLRKFIIQTTDPAAECANYDPGDPGSIFRQCIDPATVDPKTGTGLPRVWRFPFDHFRLAAHPDMLTHGFIGGSAFEHTIDMVGRRCKLDPQPAGEPPCAH